MCFHFFTEDIGIDLGTANTLIYTKAKGIVLNEPSVIAMNEDTKQVLAVGHEAKEMIGRAPSNVSVVRPLRCGVISDFIMAQAMLKEFLGRVMQGAANFRSVRVVIGVPSGVTGVEKRAVEDVVRQMGAKEVFILDEPMAAAIGVGLPVDLPDGQMVVDIGGGTSDIAIISLGGIVNSVSLRHAGDEMDEAIAAYMRKNFNLLIGDETAENIKKTLGCAIPDYDFGEEASSMEAKGRDLLSGLPCTIVVEAKDVYSALEESISTIVEGIKTTLESAPPELAADIVLNGLTLAGGGAKIKGLDILIERETGVRVTIAENALEAVAEGTGKSLEQIEKIKRYSSVSGQY